jgi:hypothetical protein
MVEQRNSSGPVGDERVKDLFSILKQLNDALGAPPPSGMGGGLSGVRQFDLPELEVDAVRKSSDPICPFIKATWNATVQYGFPNENNACYKTKKPSLVELEHQERVCYSKQFTRCPVVAPARPKRGLAAVLQHLFKPQAAG